MSLVVEERQPGICSWTALRIYTNECTGHVGIWIGSEKIWKLLGNIRCNWSLPFIVVPLIIQFLMEYLEKWKRMMYALFLSPIIRTSGDTSGDWCGRWGMSKSFTNVLKNRTELKWRVSSLYKCALLLPTQACNALKTGDNWDLETIALQLFLQIVEACTTVKWAVRYCKMNHHRWYLEWLV